MKRSAFLLLVLLFTMAGFAELSFAAKPTNDSPGAIVDFALTNGSGNPYYIRPSDGKGLLIDGVNCTHARLEYGGLNFYLNNTCGKDAPPQRTMEVNMASPANGQNPLPDYMSVTSFHIVCPGILNLTAAGQMMDIDLGWAVDIPTGGKSAINYKVRYGEGGTPLAHVTCLADSGNQCTQWEIIPGGGMDLALIFSNFGGFGVFHVPFHLIVTKK